MEWKRALTVERAAVLVLLHNLRLSRLLLSSISLVSLLSGFFRGTHNREETLEGDQELYQLLLIKAEGMSGLVYKVGRAM